MMSLEPPLLLLLKLMCMVAAIAAVALSNCRNVVIYCILLKQGLARKPFLFLCVSFHKAAEKNKVF